MQQQQQHQQQSPQMFNISPSQQQQQPSISISTEQIQKYLDENKQLILAIMESQNMGKINECAQYQSQLQKNLMYLAAIADAQPPAPTQTPTGLSQPQQQQQQQSQQQPQQQQQQLHQQQMSMQSAIPQGPFMPPPKPTATSPQTGPRMPFVLQSLDQQSPQMQYQQSMAGAMGMRMGGNNGLRPGMQTGYGTPTHLMDARNRPDGSEAGPGDDQGK